MGNSMRGRELGIREISGPMELYYKVIIIKWVNCVLTVTGKSSEKCAKYMSKGTRRTMVE